MRIGVIGIGNIGGPVAANLVEDGHEVRVFDERTERSAKLALRGAEAAADVGELAAACELTFLSLPAPAVVEEVAGSWSAAAVPDSVLIDLSTNAPETVRRVGEAVARAGLHLLEAPLTGGSVGARKRALVFMVGGDEEVYKRCTPVLDSLGRATFHVGPLGTGNVAKLVNSLLAFTATWVSIEGLALAAKAGIDLRTMVEVVRTGGAGNFYMDRMVEGINQRGGPPSFALELAAKDAGLIRDLAEDSHVPAPVAAAITEVFRSAVAAGLGERDWSDIVELIEAQADVRLELH